MSYVALPFRLRIVFERFETRQHKPFTGSPFVPRMYESVSSATLQHFRRHSFVPHSVHFLDEIVLPSIDLSSTCSTFFESFVSL